MTSVRWFRPKGCYILGESGASTPPIFLSKCSSSHIWSGFTIKGGQDQDPNTTPHPSLLLTSLSLQKSQILQEEEGTNDLEGEGTAT